MQLRQKNVGEIDSKLPKEKQVNRVQMFSKILATKNFLRDSFAHPFFC
jgi:hypothetical protein